MELDDGCSAKISNNQGLFFQVGELSLVDLEFPVTFL